MANPQITPGTGAIAVFEVNADAALSSLTATIDDPVTAYVAVCTTVAGVNLAVCPIVIPPAGVTKTVTVTMAGKTADGTVLPPITQAFDIPGPAEPPQATAMHVSNVAVIITQAPANPNSDTVTVI